MNYDKIYSFYERHRRLVLLYHLAMGKLYKPSHFKVIVSDLLDRRVASHENVVHCKAALEWLFQAQDITGVGGVAAGYSFSWGWQAPYPEVSGYIIPSIFDCARQFLDGPSAAEAKLRALRIADWLIEVQMPNGSYAEGLLLGNRSSLADRITSPGKPAAFETGQILWGLSRAYEETLDTRYLETALKAADWLVGHQNPDGSWAVSHQNVGRSFDSLLSRNLIEFSLISDRKKYRETAIRNLDWCLSQQKDNGWFNGCSHMVDDLPWTHGIMYAAQGLLEAGLLLEESKYVKAAEKAADALLKVYSVRGFKSVYEQEKGFLPAKFDSNWRSRDRFACLTGNAQISLVWSKLYCVTGDVRYLNGALKINQDLKSLQNLTSSNAGIRGGIKGSHPIYGSYCAFRYPSWAAKFFIDALIAAEKASHGMMEIRG